jgi:hypothetical protein
MTRVSAVVLAAIVVGASLAGAQTPSEIQKPGPAQEKLNYFAGTWRLEVHMKASPFGPRAFFATEHNEWMPGGLLLVSRQEGETAVAAGGLAVMGYNTQEKAYTYHVVKSTGEIEDLKGTLEGHTWTWTGDGTTGSALKTRLTIKEVSAVSYALKLETASEGRDWSTVMEGRATKALADARQDVAYRR